MPRIWMLLGVLAEHGSSGGEIAETRRPAPPTPVSGKIGLPGCARIEANASVDTLPSPLLPPNREPPEPRPLSRATHDAVGDPCSMLRRLLHLVGSEVRLIRRPIVEALVRPALVVKMEVARQGKLQLPQALVGVEVDVLVFDTPPQPLDEHIVDPTPAPVHAEVHPVVDVGGHGLQDARRAERVR